MLRILLVLLLFITSACSNKYIVLTGKDGKKTVFKKQTPEFNKMYIEKQKRSGNVKRINEVASDKKIEREENKFVSDSTAYSDKSVLDKNKVINETIKKNNSITKDLIKESGNNAKTIDDFDYLPNSIFADSANKVTAYTKNINEDDIITLGQNKNNGSKTDNIEVVNVSKKKSKWKFWGRNREKTTGISDNATFMHDSENDVPREDDTTQNSILNANVNSIDANSYNNDALSNRGSSDYGVVYGSSNRDETVLNAKKISQKQYNEKLLDNNKLLNQTAGLKKGKFYVQIISVRNEAKCRKFLRKYDINGRNSMVYPVNLDGVMYYRGIIGPFDSLTKAEMEKERIINMGHYDVFIFKQK